MRIWVDTADIVELRECLAAGFASGVTTNPSLLAKAGTTVGRVVAAVGSLPLSVECVEEAPDAMLREAEALVSEFPRLIVKVPMAWEYLPVVRALADRHVPVNVTCCMASEQAAMAAAAGAKYVSMFWNRIRDGGGDPEREVRRAYRCGIPVIVGSIRNVKDVGDALASLAEIVTVPPRVLREMCQHPETTKVIREFTEASRWKSC